MTRRQGWRSRRADAAEQRRRADPTITVRHVQPQAERPFLSKKQVREVLCPTCAAPAGRPCIDHRGTERITNHLERVRAAQQETNPTG